MQFSRRGVIALPLLAAIPVRVLAGVSLTPADQALVDQAVGYLEGLGDAKGRFRQTDWRGGVTEGTIYVARPGRARFEYDPPAGLVIVSDGKTVTVANGRLKTNRRYPLDSTPLGLFLAKQIRLDRGVRLTGVQRRREGGFSITARDGRGRAQGEITLDFDEAPLRLSGWAITDPQHRTTTVQLADFARVGSLSPDLFAPPDERG
ncbi:MAG: outer-membrane lipoprotein carrier protein LolA [Caulobacteraceae bacterium]|nr:outer-membrane lipoprotein carrier protein LolA [Caulobacteraceae bacterium]